MTTIYVQFHSLGWVTSIGLSRADYLSFLWSLELPETDYELELEVHKPLFTEDSGRIRWAGILNISSICPSSLVP